MKRRLFPSLLAPLLALAATASGNTASPQLDVQVDTPQVAVSPRDAGRTLVQLPDLQYRFRLAPHCGADWTPVTVSLSVADSRLTLDGDALAGTPEPHSASLHVPASQLAPLPVSGFCERPLPDADGLLTSADDATGRLTVRAAMSAHAALLCAADDQQRITTRSHPLTLFAPGDVQAGSTDSP
ncbi:MAG: hypothetical protein U5K76_10365 [Woeseiaceae bacterium]|nr:hypothetical protein [Woeseiaceae bacterium]